MERDRQMKNEKAYAKIVTGEKLDYVECVFPRAAFADLIKEIRLQTNFAIKSDDSMIKFTVALKED